MAMHRTRTLVLVLVATLVASFTCLTGCDPRVDYPPPPPPGPNPAQMDLARRMAETQLLNGAWGFIGQPWYAPIDYTFSGYQNVTGAASLGLFDAYKADLADDGVAQDMWFVPGALEMTKDYLIQWMDDFVNGTVNPSAEEPAVQSGTIPTNIAMPNFVFCKRYDDLFRLTAGEQGIVQSAFDLLLANRDATHGTEPSVIADGVFNRIVESRTLGGIPGLIGWDVAHYVRALVAMQSPLAEINWVVDHMKTLPSLDPGIPLGLISIAHVLTVLNLVGDTSMNATLLAAMQSERNPDGSYGADSSHQTTAFCLMALKTLGLTSDAVTTQAWLETQIHAGGFVFDATTNTEAYEEEGEMLWSLIHLTP